MPAELEAEEEELDGNGDRAESDDSITCDVKERSKASLAKDDARRAAKEQAESSTRPLSGRRRR